MNIAIDIDDTITDSFDYIQPYVAEYFKVDLEELKSKNISYSNLPEGWDEVTFGQKYYDDKIPGAPFKPDVAESIKRLKEMGHQIFIITARTDLFYKEPYRTTEEVLKKGGIIYDKLVCTLDKGAACREENIDVLIDDSVHNCDCAAAVGVKTVLFTSKANAQVKTEHTRAHGWKDVIELLK